MEESTVLVTLSFFMLIGSYLAGSIPLVMSMSEAKLQMVSVFGAGLLVGTALAVIIPEGIRALLSSGHEKGVATDTQDIHAVIGFSLVLGFVLMLIIDQCSSMHFHDTDFGERGSSSLTATIGLVVHSAVDGVALGAAATTTHTDVEMLVFIAIMLHKAPAAFGLVSFLMHEGIERERIRRHLLVFSLAAPLLALITYFGIGPEGKEKMSSVNATGIAMLFSAGTFVYVATVHVLPELTVRSGGTFQTKQLLALILGTLTPLILTFSHHH